MIPLYLSPETASQIFCTVLGSLIQERFGQVKVMKELGHTTYKERLGNMGLFRCKKTKGVDLTAAFLSDAQ